METRRPGGIRSSTLGFEDVGPGVHQVELGASLAGRLLHEGHRPACPRRWGPPRSGRGPRPGADGWCPPARWARWKATRAVTSRSLRTSPFRAMKVSSIPAWSAAKRMAPAVSPRGSGSTSSVQEADPGRHAARVGTHEGVGQVPEREHRLVHPVGGRVPETRSIMGTSTMGSICLGIERVRGLRPVSSPPTRTTAFTPTCRRGGGVRGRGAVEEVLGTVVPVGRVVDVVGAWPLAAERSAVMAVAGGLGSFFPDPLGARPS